MVVIKTKNKIYELTTEDIERFWSKVDKTDNCWLWNAYRNEDGYGQFWITNNMEKAHRISYLISKGNIEEDDLCVLHECDNPPCVNPAHLFLGTMLDNIVDSKNKGRRPYQNGTQNIPKGKEHYRAMFTDDDILNIRNKHTEGSTINELCKEYNAKYGTIYSIVRKLRWKHI